MPEGAVDVTWSVNRDPATGHPILSWSWQERGGPPVTPPRTKSFGTRLIKMGLGNSGDGSVDLDYALDGLRCRIVAGLTELQRSES